MTGLGHLGLGEVVISIEEAIGHLEPRFSPPAFIFYLNLPSSIYFLPIIYDSIFLLVDEMAHVVHQPPAALQKDAHVKSLDEYRTLYDRSIKDPAVSNPFSIILKLLTLFCPFRGSSLISSNVFFARHYIDLENIIYILSHSILLYYFSFLQGFWGDFASQFHWNKKWDPSNFSEFNFDLNNGSVGIKWFMGAETNIAYNCLDRHVLAGNGDRVAFICEANDVGPAKKYTYKQVLDETCKLANYLKSQGVGKSDNVTIYMPMIAELPIAMLACARIGAIHSVVFAGFSAESLAGRIVDSEPKAVITCSGVRRAKKVIELKKIVDEALEICDNQEEVHVPRVIVYDHAAAISREAESMCHFHPERDVWWQDVVVDMSTECPVEWMEAEEPLFKLYTSGSTGKPKGVLHSTAGYMVGTAATFHYVFDYKPEDVYWCTADCGWITGHSYVTYGPMLMGATQIVFEGVPTFPDAGRCWDVCDTHNVTVFYTAPTAIRTLMACGDAFVNKYNRTSLRILGTVGEPINPEAWRWYNEVVGNSNCAIVDTWWQTETGAHMITPLPGATPLKPGSATLPFFGVQPALLDDQGKEIEGAGAGYLVIKKPWPSMLRTVAGDHHRFEQTYFSHYKGYYFTGDGARRDEDGYYWITGRVDDVINVSGHRIGTAEVESALVGHPLCAEAAVVPVDHPIKGQAIYAFITLMGDQTYPPDHTVKLELVAAVRKAIGPIASPDVIHWAPGLPKTRSGKIMRRVLRKIANEEESSLGDTSTLADPSVVQTLLSLRGK